MTLFGEMNFLIYIFEGPITTCLTLICLPRKIYKWSTKIRTIFQKFLADVTGSAKMPPYLPVISCKPRLDCKNLLLSFQKLFCERQENCQQGRHLQVQEQHQHQLHRLEVSRRPHTYELLLTHNRLTFSWSSWTFSNIYSNVKVSTWILCCS